MDPPLFPLAPDAEDRAGIIFFEALTQPPEQRPAFLDAACAADPALRAEVGGLLRDYEKAGRFLEGNATIFTGVKEEFARLQPEAAGDRIGPYKLLQQIGEGGFGVVWMAEQVQPVRRRVALKIIKPGMDTKEVVARFEQERQALAVMEHPNIATVLDAGVTQFGRPFFVMELVRGIKITQYCDEAQLTTHARLQLFIAVCHAVQHAHQKGIIHRDLKPSNILVTLHDGVPVPKVIDFGVAKAIQQQRLSDFTVFTRFEQMIGTPLYMSPEQAEMSGLDIDTRSDIYSLGVLLYELLTGRTPFDPGELLKQGLDEIRRVIREDEPQKPSTFVSSLALDLRSTLAQHRQSDHAKFISQIRGDLDWIVMKALEKDRNRRYGTANDFAQDIQRHLQNEPVEARPATQFYRFRRFAKRNKTAFAAGSGIAAALVLGLAASTWMFFKEKQARERAVSAEQQQVKLRQAAEDQERKATVEAHKSSQVARFLTDMLQGVGPSVALGRDTRMLREILDKTAERVSEDLMDQPAVAAELRSTMGDVYHDLDEVEKAAQLHGEALAMLRKLHGNEHLLVADLLIKLSSVSYDGGMLGEAETLAREALAIRIKLLGSEHLSVAAAIETIGIAVNEQGRLPEAESLYRKALAMRRKLQRNEDTPVASTLTRLAHNRGWQGHEPEAEELLRDAIAITKKVVGSQHPSVTYPLHYLARSLLKQNRPAEAESQAREAWEIAKKVFGEGHSTTVDQLATLSCALIAQGKREEAEAMILKAPEVATARARLSRLLIFTDRLEDLETLYRAAPDVLRNSVSGYPNQLEELLSKVAESLYRQNKSAEAELLYREALASRQARLSAEDPAVHNTAASLARLLADWAWSERGSSSGAKDLKPEIAARAREAESRLREGLAIRLKSPEAAHWRTTGETTSRLGGALVAVAVTDADLSGDARLAKLAEAATLLLNANEVLQTSKAVARKYKRDSFTRIVRLYEALEKPEEALKWQQKLDDFDKPQPR